MVDFRHRAGEREDKPGASGSANKYECAQKIHIIKLIMNRICQWDTWSKLKNTYWTKLEHTKQLSQSGIHLKP